MWGNDAMTWRYKIADFFGLKKNIVALLAMVILVGLVLINSVCIDDYLKGGLLKSSVDRFQWWSQCTSRMK